VQRITRDLHRSRFGENVSIFLVGLLAFVLLALSVTGPGVVIRMWAPTFRVR
jgi:uncharacterized iron-regulated membrane protein